jgi:ADP-ribose pyrophosphatase
MQGNEIQSCETRVVAEGRHLRFVVRNGWEFVERRRVSGIVVLVAVTRRGGLVLVTQPRVPVGGKVVELPAGLAGDEDGLENENLADAARRELMEETGFAAERVEPVVSGPPGAGLSSEIVTLYWAPGVVRTGRGGGVAGEKIRVHVVPLRRVEEWLGQMEKLGYLVDPKVLAGLYVAMKHGAVKGGER